MRVYERLGLGPAKTGEGGGEARVDLKLTKTLARVLWMVYEHEAWHAEVGIARLSFFLRFGLD
jgi:hypothetical protein